MRDWTTKEQAMLICALDSYIVAQHAERQRMAQGSTQRTAISKHIVELDTLSEKLRETTISRPLYCILQKGGEEDGNVVYIIPHEDPDLGPHRTLKDVHRELDHHATMYEEEDMSQYVVFAMTSVQK